MRTKEPGSDTQRIIECAVDILRRSGPGVLHERRLRSELRRCRPSIVLTPEQLQEAVDEAEGRLLQLDVYMDLPPGAVLDSRVVLMDPEDAPPPPGLANSLWRSLAAMADDVDLRSRISVTRWNLQAERAEQLCAAAARDRNGPLERPARPRANVPGAAGSPSVRPTPAPPSRATRSRGDARGRGPREARPRSPSSP